MKKLDIENEILNILLKAGEDPQREGLKKTPERVARAMGEILSGYGADIDKVFNNAFFKADYKEMVLVKNIDFYSMCEHHMLPFFGKAHIAYIPDGVIVGLSKIPRLVEAYAKRLQIQERLTIQVAETLYERLKPKGVAVVIEARHLCVIMRGVKNETSAAVTSSMLGCFEKDTKIRNEFLTLIKNKPE